MMKDESRNYHSIPYDAITEMARQSADYLEPLFLPQAKVMEEITDRLGTYRKALAIMVCEHTTGCPTCRTDPEKCEGVIEELESRLAQVEKDK
jgi:hypothetical protein